QFPELELERHGILDPDDPFDRIVRSLYRDGAKSFATNVAHEHMHHDAKGATLADLWAEWDGLASRLESDSSGTADSTTTAERERLSELEDEIEWRTRQAAHAAELGLTAGDLDEFAVTDQYLSEHVGVTHVYLQQVHEGLAVANAVLNVNVGAAGEVLSVGSSFVAGLDALPASGMAALSPSQALISLGDFFDWGVDSPRELHKEGTASASTLVSASGVSREDIPVEMHYVATESGVQLAWRLNVQTVDGDHWYDASVSAASGKVLQVIDWAAGFADYRVFPLPLENPDDGARSLVRDPHHASGSPFGWHDNNGAAGNEFTDTRGNNVWAQEDRDNNNTGGFRPGGDIGGGNLTFDFPIDFSQAPLTYESAVISNLFSMNNVLHDIHYLYGFNEAAGNFQTTNYTGQGAGNDHVLADAQDGSGVNNANFATPPEGTNPRMQQYIFNRTTPNRDSDLDNTIIVHEYGHGVSNRLTGGPGNSGALQSAQSRAMGEGWSDWWSLMLTQKSGDGQNDAYPVGNYVLGLPPNGPGIRNFPYSFDMAVNPLTYADITTLNQPHGAGEVWASALWDLNWLLINKHGYEPDVYNAASGKGNTLALQLVMDGLKLQPANPSMLDARNAILLADRNLTGGANQLEIWTAFARRGMGYSALDGGSANSLSVIEAFDLPPTSQGVVELDRDAYGVGESLNVTLRDRDLAGAGTAAVLIAANGGDSETITLNESAAGVFAGGINTASGAATPGNAVLEVLGGQVITVTYNDADNGAGSPAVAADAAAVIVLVDIFNQDFEQGLGAGESVAGAFTVNSTNAFLSNGTMMAGHPGNYGNNEYSYYQATVDLQDYQYVSLEFDYAVHIEDFWDGFNVLAAAGAISPPAGLLPPVAGMQYDPKSGLSPNIGSVGFDGGGNLATGRAKFDLSPFAGEVVTLRFQFGSDGSVVFPGIKLDNLRIRGANVAIIEGRKWNDLDGDSVQDAGEPGLPGWIIYADLDGDRDRDAVEPFAITDQNGDYVLTVAPGEFTVREERQPGWRQTTPRPRLFAVRGENGATPTIYELDAAGAVLNSFPAPAAVATIGPQGLAAGPRSLFYIDGRGAGQQAHTLYELDLNTGAVLDADVLPPTDETAGIAFLNGLVYIEVHQPNEIVVFNPLTDRVLTTLTAPADLIGGLT
ncbi:MAG: M36 family metallopeptidase, partial [Planctomycetes bacterium]|nr:M36 family metallopeptidase [Planctomycetota bacterium]